MKAFFRGVSHSMKPEMIKSKFRGCLLGALMGDCLGAPYEGEEVTSGDKIVLQRYFDRMEDPDFKSPFKKYTDDTAMTKSVAQFLIDKPEPDLQHLAKLFTSQYFKEPRRGYGQGVVEVFEKLKNTKYKDVFRPAQEQFDGRGSYGNGGAMRIAPVALYFYDNAECLIDIARKSTQITHTHLLGINGAVLQCLAVQQAFTIDSERPIDKKDFYDSLAKKMKDIESECYEESDKFPFCEQLDKMWQFLEREHSDDLDDEVIYTLGHGIAAHQSVVTAIYCFLRAQNPIPRIETANTFRRTIQYAISLGGDTDTIASMAGAICGAYLGEDAIDKATLQHCEKFEQIQDLADKL